MEVNGNEMDKARAALAFVANEDRETWVRMGMAIKAEFGDAGRDLWDEWSQPADSYNGADAATVWKSFREGGAITIASLYHEAKQAGWKPNGYGIPRDLSPQEIAERERRVRESKERDDREAVEAAAKAVAIWREATQATREHPYLRRKGVAPVVTLRCLRAAAAAALLRYPPKAGGEPLTGLLLVAPIKAGENIVSVELIDGDGRKAVIAGSRVSGGYWAAQPMPEGDGEGLTLAVGEGAATVLSAREASGCVAVAARACGNLRAVAESMRAKYPKARIVILADLGNGEDKARAAAAAVGADLALPDFGPDRPEGAKDFNDLALHRGVEAVRKALQLAAPAPVGEPQPSPADRSGAVVEGWPDPQPLISETGAEPYPLDALPAGLGAAVREVVDFVQCPPALAACSALSALSVVAQGLVDVRRAHGLQGPVSLNVLAIAESGERKTTCDGFFLTSIRDWEAERAEAHKPDKAKHEADNAAWEATRNGLVGKIKNNSEKDKPSDQEKLQLRELEAAKPEAPKIPRLLLGESTPEALAWSLARLWPTAGIISSEAGTIFGGHAMKPDQVMRNLAQLNVLWEGGTLRTERRTSDSFAVRGARLTLGLAVQPDTLRAFVEATKGQARGSGFAARFLIAWPESTQGARLFREAPPNWPRLSVFHRRIAELLREQETLALTESGGLSPVVLDLSPEAKAAWISFHDEIEGELRDGGDMDRTRDVASKAADNAARLAAIFHLFEHGPAGTISLEHLEAAARLATWHLYESRRFLGELSMPVSTLNAAALERWLLRRCKTAADTVKRQEVQAHGPRALRHGKALDEAITELEALDRARLVIEGRQKLLRPNPALLGGNHGAP